MRPIQSARSAGAGKGALRRLALTGVLLALALGWMVPPVAAQITSVSPGSAHVAPGSSVGVSVTTDLSNVSLAAGSAPGVTVGRGGSAPTFTFTFTAFTSATPGTYSYTFTDGASTGSFTLIVDSPPATTTTTTTTTTRPPTTTTRPPTTTTRPTTTTTRPPTTTTSTTSTTTTTAPTTTAPTTTTSTTTTTLPPTTTTTTLPPTTTTSTLVPAGITAIGDDGGSSSNPFIWLGGGAVFIALALSALLVLWSRRRPTYGAATPGLVLAWRNRSERRRVEKQRSPGRSAGFNNWWHTSGPVVSYREWKSSRHAGRTVQRQIEERRRLRRHDD